jgi:hypothetical protein
LIDIRQLTCKIFNHKLKVVKNLPGSTQKLKCLRCFKYFAIKHDLQMFMSWDDELTTLYRDLYNIEC